MTLRLKDREQQAWLDKMTGGLFTEALKTFMEDAEQIEFQINERQFSRSNGTKWRTLANTTRTFGTFTPK